MSVKAYDKKIAAFAGFLIQNVPADISEDVMDGWMDDPEALKKFLEGLNREHIIEIDGDESFEQMVAAGRYDWRNDNLNEKNFPINKGKGRKRFGCRLFPAGCASEIGVKRIEAAGFKPGETEHLLKFGSTSPNLQRKNPIAGLGSTARVDGKVGVPCLDGDGALRILGLSLWDDDWSDDWRLLGVREISGSQT